MYTGSCNVQKFVRGSGRQGSREGSPAQSKFQMRAPGAYPSAFSYLRHRTYDPLPSIRCLEG